MSLFAIIILGLCADLINTTETFFDVYFVFSALGLAIAILTILTLPAM